MLISGKASKCLSREPSSTGSVSSLLSLDSFASIEFLRDEEFFVPREGETNESDTLNESKRESEKEARAR